MAFMDFPKACDRIQRSETWRCTKNKDVNQKYVRIAHNMSDQVTLQVISCIGATNKFRIRVGLHQGSDLIVDVIREGVPK